VQPKGKVVSSQEYYNWTHHQHNQKKCFCGKFACIGFQYRLGMIELLCFKHYQERINKCQKEWEHTEAKEADHRKKNQLSLL
jgi:hypothetical protein